MPILDFSYKEKKTSPFSNSLLSILLFLNRGECRWLSQTLQTINNQTCSLWELIIVAPHEKFLAENKLLSVLDKDDAKHYKIIVSTLPPHKIAQEAKGDFISFLVSGDILHKHFVGYFFQQQQTTPSLRFFYTDHQPLIDYNPFAVANFKPDWNPDYLHAYNYISRAVVFFRQDLIDLSRDIQEDYFHQLLLTVTASYQENEIYHAAKILFYLHESEHESPLPFTHYFVVQHTPTTSPLTIRADRLDKPLVSIIIPTKNQTKLLTQCLNSLLKKTTYPSFELLIIDNQSDDPTTLRYLEQLSKKDNIRVLRYPHPFNYSAINNFAVKQAKGSLITLLNDDIEIINRTWLDEMVIHALRPEIGCVGAKLYYPDGTIQHGGVILGIKGTASHAHKYFPKDHSGYCNRLSVVHNVSAVTAACLVMRKDLFEAVGGFDAVNLKVAYNDVDLCLKVMKLGYRNLWTPYAELIHYESKSRGKKRSWWQRRKLRKEARFLQQKWGKLLLNDPCYNPNLTLDCEDFSPKRDDE